MEQQHGTSAAVERQRIVVHPEDNGQALENPGMGWVIHYYDNDLYHYGGRLEPSDALEDYPGITVIYFRLPWVFLEPEEGHFNWELLDTPAQRWISRGKKIALCISCCEWMPFATPEWVRAAGAQGHMFTPGKGVDPAGPYWEPDYNDPVFLQKLDAFVAAAAARYDGAPEVAFIDVGSFGVWGEMHNFWSSKINYDAATVIRHLDLYAKHFTRTLLVSDCAAADHGRGLASIVYAQEHGMSIRDNSILVLEEEITPQRWSLVSTFWQGVPVVLECQHYGPSVEDGFWKDGSGYLQAVEDYHASYASIHWWPREFLAENRELVAQINRRMGYRLQLVEAAWIEIVTQGEDWEFASQWRNVGVAPCLPGGFLAVTLKDAQGGIVAVFIAEHFSLAELPVQQPDETTTMALHGHFRIATSLAAGAYELFVSVGSRLGTPQIALPLAEDDGQRRYKLGLVVVQADPRVAQVSQETE